MNHCDLIDSSLYELWMLGSLFAPLIHPLMVIKERVVCIIRARYGHIKRSYLKNAYTR